MARILVVDDEPVDRMILESLLTQLGHRPVFAEDAEFGLALYQRGSFDLVVTDLVLPGHSGVQLINELLRRDPNALIVAISGRSPDQLRRAKTCGAIEGLAKPLSFKRLASVLEKILVGNDSQSTTAAV